MSSTLPDRQSLKRKADDAMLMNPPSPAPDTKTARTTPTEKPGHFAPRSDPIDDQIVARTEMKCKRILEARTQIIRDRVAIATALEYNPAELAKNVKTIKEGIMEGIKGAMVWTPTFEDFRDSKFLVGFKLQVGPKTNQLLRAVFPGVGVHNGNGKEKGWYSNVYSVAEFQDLMGIDVVARVRSSIAELSGDVAVYCLVQEGDLKLQGMYRVVDPFSQSSFRIVDPSSQLSFS